MDTWADSFECNDTFKRQRRKVLVDNLDQNNWFIGGAIILSSYLSYESSSDAADAEAEATEDEVAELRRQFDLTRKDLEPFRELELKGTERSERFFQRIEDELLGGESKFKESPGYQYRIDQASKAVDRKASQQGRLNTPSYDLDLNRNIQGEASNEFQRYLNNLFGGAGVASPQGATGQTVQANQNTSNRISDAYSDLGTSRANDAINKGNIYTNTIDQFARYYG